MTALSTTIKAAAVALTLAGTAISAMPAQAQNFNFSFGNDNFRWSIGTGGRNDRVCISNREVRRDLRRDGYDDIRFIDRRGRVVAVYAELGRRAYIIQYDTCRERIIDRDRVRR
jgi:hypothetical protein